jgi:hypothetical protein
MQSCKKLKIMSNTGNQMQRSTYRMIPLISVTKQARVPMALEIRIVTIFCEGKGR